MRRAVWRLMLFGIAGNLSGCIWVQLYGTAWLSERGKKPLPTFIVRVNAEGMAQGTGAVPFAGSRIVLETRDHRVVLGEGVQATPRSLRLHFSGEGVARELLWKDLRCLVVQPSPAHLRNTRIASGLIYGALVLGLAYESWRFSRDAYLYSRDIQGKSPSMAFWEAVSMNLHPVYITPFQLALLFSVHAVLTDRMIARQNIHPPLVTVVRGDLSEDSVRAAAERCRWVAAALLLPRLSGDGSASP